MPRKPPPLGGHAPAVTTTLAAGTRLWRVHSDRRDAHAMNPTVPPAGRGGRFDSADGAYAHLYLGRDPEAAIAETLCRSLPLDGSPRIVARQLLSGRVLTALEVRADITVAALYGPHLAAIGQDLWLTKSPSRDYPLTRAWAAAVLTARVTGLEYRCRHDETRTAWMLTTAPEVPRHPDLTVVPESSVALDTPAGREQVRAVLDEHSAVLSP